MGNGENLMLMRRLPMRNKQVKIGPDMPKKWKHIKQVILHHLKQRKLRLMERKQLPIVMKNQLKIVKKNLKRAKKRQKVMMNEDLWEMTSENRDDTFCIHYIFTKEILIKS